MQNGTTTLSDAPSGEILRSVSCAAQTVSSVGADVQRLMDDALHDRRASYDDLERGLGNAFLPVGLEAHVEHEFRLGIVKNPKTGYRRMIEFPVPVVKFGVSDSGSFADFLSGIDAEELSDPRWKPLRDFLADLPALLVSAVFLRFEPGSDASLSAISAAFAMGKHYGRLGLASSLAPVESLRENVVASRFADVREQCLRLAALESAYDNCLLATFCSPREAGASTVSKYRKKVEETCDSLRVLLANEHYHARGVKLLEKYARFVEADGREIPDHVMERDETFRAALLSIECCRRFAAEAFRSFYAGTAES